MIKGKIIYFFIQIGISIFYIIPFRILYILSNFFRFLAENIIKYRKKVILKNLKNAFPERSETEIKNIKRDVYINISDLLLEGLKGFTLSKKTLIKRVVVKNPELADKYFDKNLDIILLTSHITTWEWTCLILSHYFKHEFRAVYKELKNTQIEKFSYLKRTQFGTKLYPNTRTRDFFYEESDKPRIFYMLPDQNPASKGLAHWRNFFNIDTAFIHGPKKYFDKLQIPILYLNIVRVKRGFYECELMEFVTEDEVGKDIDVTGRYVELLEKLIRTKPGNWLWSHKRWKHTRN